MSDQENSLKPMGEFPGEVAWYNDAYSDTATRVERGYYWDSEPSTLVAQLFESYQGDRERVLDVACGDGPHLVWLLEQGFQEVVGVDFNESALAAASKRAPHAKVIQADLTIPDSLLQIGTFNLLTLHSILDHVRPEHRPIILKNLRSAIKPGGAILIVEFAPGLVGVPENMTWKEVGGHYSCVYTHEELVSFFPDFTVLANISGPISDLHPETIMNGVLLQAPGE